MSKQPLKDDPLRSVADALPGAVLLSDQIEYYCRKIDPPLISTADYSQIPEQEFVECIDHASYKLRLGDEAHVGGQLVRISKETPLVLKPHQVAVVKTYESVNIPRFIVARWNLRVTWVYEGLLWVGGPQVDPGWTGQLFCPIYNLAEREVVIKYMDRVFTIDFTRTTPFHEGPASYEYTSRSDKDHQSRRYTLQDHDRNRLRSAPFEEIQKLESLDAKVNTFVTFTVIILSVFIGALSVVAVLANPAAPNALQKVTSNYGNFNLSLIAVIFSFASLVVSALAAGMRFNPSTKNAVKFLLFSFVPMVFLAGAGGIVTWLITVGVPEDISVAFKLILTALPFLLVILAVAGLFSLWKWATKAKLG